MSWTEYEVILCRNFKDFNRKLNELGLRGFTDRRIYYFPATRYHDTEYIAVMVKEHKV